MEEKQTPEFKSDKKHKFFTYADGGLIEKCLML